MVIKEVDGKNNSRKKIELGKKAAIEMSIGTIIIIVLGVTMLILGMVLVRAVMCTAIGLTEETGKKAASELDKYFQEKNDEVVCIGESGETAVTPDARSYIWCSFNSEQEAEYTITLKSYDTLSSSVSKNSIKSWIKKSEGKWTVAAGDKTPKAPIILDIPKNAPEGSFNLNLEVKKKIKGENEASIIMSPEVYLKVTRVGFVKTAIC